MSLDGAITSDSIILFWPSFVGATLIALVHLLVPKFRFLHNQNKQWIPASTGVALAYVFMEIFPHLSKAQEKLTETAENTLYGLLAHNIYFVGLAGFSIYLGVILSVRAFRKGGTAAEITFKSAPAAVKVEWVSLVAYNFLIGYLLSEQITHRPEPVLLSGLAMAIHFIGVDYLVHNHFPKLYGGPLRLGLAIGVYTGWITGIVSEIADGTLSLWYSFLAGGIIVIATVNELPQIRSFKQYGAFLTGMGVFATLMLAADYIGV